MTLHPSDGEPLAVSRLGWTRDLPLRPSLLMAVKKNLKVGGGSRQSLVICREISG